jgi:hypothetical protein
MAKLVADLTGVASPMRCQGISFDPSWSMPLVYRLDGMQQWQGVSACERSIMVDAFGLQVGWDAAVARGVGL